MQTFLPFPDFKKTAQCLDYKRLGKQRVEAMQIINILTGITPNSRWKNHPAVKMWRGYEEALMLYCNVMIAEWKLRGYNNSMTMYTCSNAPKMPPWIGSKMFHKKHRATLLVKNPEWYGKFGWKEKPKYEYEWPIA